MDLSKRRAGVKNPVVAGSVWESRMKSIDEVKKDVKLSNENSQENSDSKPRIKKSTQGSNGGVASSGKRKTWKSDSSEGSPIQIAKQRSETAKKCDEVKSPIQVVKKGRSDIDGSPIQLRKSRSEVCKDIVESGKAIEKSPIQLRKAKSESSKTSDQVSKSVDVKEKNLILAKKSRSELDKVSDVSEVKTDENEKMEVETENDMSEENCKEFGVCEENVSSGNVGVSKGDQEELMHDENDVLIDENGAESEEGYEDVEDKQLDEGNEVEIEAKSFDIKEIQIPEQKPKNVVVNQEKEIKSMSEQQKPKKVVTEVRKFHQINTRTVPRSTIVKQQPPSTRRSTLYQNFAKPTPSPVSAKQQTFQESHSKLQNLVDLVMWRDVSRSAFVFGLGTFMIISSSYTQDLNISFISVISYLGLVYLAAIFLYRSIICRGVIYTDDQNYVIGEEEGIWLLKLILPYLNEFLLKIRALFSGDPSTTMKLAALLFVLARCGNYITIWKMAKLGFFGVFIIPKVCTSYSSQLTAYGKFWIRRFHDAWDSCTHKKAVAIAIFTLVWNMSSVVARVWAVFMLYVALRYYQQSAMTDNSIDDDEIEVEVEEVQPQFRRGPTVVELTKEKKAC